MINRVTQSLKSVTARWGPPKPQTSPLITPHPVSLYPLLSGNKFSKLWANRHPTLQELTILCVRTHSWSSFVPAKYLPEEFCDIKTGLFQLIDWFFDSYQVPCSPWGGRFVVFSPRLPHQGRLSRRCVFQHDCHLPIQHNLETCHFLKTWTDLIWWILKQKIISDMLLIALDNNFISFHFFTLVCSNGPTMEVY